MKNHADKTESRYFSASSATSTVKFSLLYDAANRLTGVDGVSYTWDARGNLRSNGVFTYIYDGAGRMVRAESVSATVVYTYGLDSLLVGRSAGGAAATYAWDWATGVPEMLSDGERLYLVAQETLGWADGAEWSYPLGDALGSVRQVVDGAGEVLDDRSWTPFGVEEGTAQGGLGYTGEWWDAEVSLLYLRARWYDPTAGRFTTEDPWKGELERPISLQGYLYVSNDPINCIDPSGNIDFMIWQLALNGGNDSALRGCTSGPDYQPFASLNIYLGDENADRSYEKGTDTVSDWNNAPAGMLRALNRATLGMNSLLGPAFGQRMGESLGGKAVIVYAPPGWEDSKLAYMYVGWGGIRVGSNRLDQGTATRSFLQRAGMEPSPEDGMTSGFAHEYAHLISRIVDGPEGQQAIGCAYCEEVRGFINHNGTWASYPVFDGKVLCGACDPQLGCTKAYYASSWEAVADVVGVYIAKPTAFFARNIGTPLGGKPIRDFIERTFVQHMQ